MFTAPFSKMRTFKRQMRFLLPSIKVSAALSQPPTILRGARYSNHIVEHSSDHETVLGSSRMLGGAAEHLIAGSEKRTCRFGVRMLLKVAVKLERSYARNLRFHVYAIPLSANLDRSSRFEIIIN